MAWAYTIERANAGRDSHTFTARWAIGNRTGLVSILQIVSISILRSQTTAVITPYLHTSIPSHVASPSVHCRCIDRCCLYALRRSLIQMSMTSTKLLRIDYISYIVMNQSLLVATVTFLPPQAAHRSPLILIQVIFSSPL